MNKLIRLSALLCASALVCACGGGGTSAATPASDTSTSTPSGLYIGYYQEDPANNPEDPTIGAFSLNLPADDSPFQGSMYFTYVGCQNSNVGVVAGAKSGLQLSGTWGGPVDGLQQTGNYSGTFDKATATYAGTFNNNGGKQFRDLSPCIEYTIAANGTWEMFPIESSTPSTFVTTVNLPNVSWTSIAAANQTLVYVLDPVIAQGAGNPVLWQDVVFGGVTSVVIPSSVTLSPGKEYIVVVAVTNAQSQRIAFTSKRVTR
jgi:hypothetical protein